MLIFLSVSGPPQLCVDCGRALARDGTQRYIRSQKTRSKCRRGFNGLRATHPFRLGFSNRQFRFRSGWEGRACALLPTVRPRECKIVGWEGDVFGRTERVPQPEMSPFCLWMTGSAQSASAALVSERERVRRQYLPPADALIPRPAKSHKIYCFANTLVLSWEWILLTGGFL